MQFHYKPWKLIGTSLFSIIKIVLLKENGRCTYCFILLNFILFYFPLYNIFLSHLLYNHCRLNQLFLKGNSCCLWKFPSCRLGISVGCTTVFFIYLIPNQNFRKIFCIPSLLFLCRVSFLTEDLTATKIKYGQVYTTYEYWETSVLAAVNAFFLCSLT